MIPIGAVQETKINVLLLSQEKAFNSETLPFRALDCCLRHCRCTNGDKTIIVTENESTCIPLGAIHALETQGKIPLQE